MEILKLMCLPRDNPWRSSCRKVKQETYCVFSIFHEISVRCFYRGNGMKGGIKLICNITKDEVL